MDRAQSSWDSSRAVGTPLELLKLLGHSQKCEEISRDVDTNIELFKLHMSYWDTT